MRGREIIIGSRSSQLALRQTELVEKRLRELYPEHHFSIKKVRTKGDKITDVALARVGGKGLFTKEIEESLLRGEVDLAVHSLKDLPTEIPQGLVISAVTERGESHDVLVSKNSLTLSHLQEKAKIGTSSLRRRAQLLKFRPDLQMMNLRGNLNTRLEKLKGPGLDAIVAAGAGFERMGWEGLITEIISFDIILPAAGQGALGIEIREEDAEIKRMVARLNDENSLLETTAERSFLKTLGGGCQIPVGVLGRLQNKSLLLKGVVLSPDGQRFVRSSIIGKGNEAQELGKELADKVLDSGGEELLDLLAGKEEEDGC